MKAKIAIAVGLLLCASAPGFTQARDGQVTIEKNKREAVMIEIQAPPAEVEKALQQRFTEKGFKAKKSKGSYGYKNVSMSDWGPDTLNVFTRVEPASNGASRVYIAASRPDGSFISSQLDSGMANKMKNYLYDLVSDNRFASNDYDIYRYSDSVMSDQTNYSRYSEDRKRLEEQRTKLDAQLKDMESQYNKNRGDWDRRKARLSELQNGNESIGTVNSAKNPNAANQDSSQKRGKMRQDTTSRGKSSNYKNDSLNRKGSTNNRQDSMDRRQNNPTRRNDTTNRARRDSSELAPIKRDN
ncbi:MAG: hypothetical protein H7Y31_15000 [Chitinophagaceae bacterium]|nr:hypothetical protein [Chitinophagaceae bacterium]